jgi:excisionase family DNA binding protein
MINEDKYMTVQEVATKFRVKILTVYRWIYAGKVRPKKVGRKYLFSEKDIMQLMGR